MRGLLLIVLLALVTSSAGATEKLPVRGVTLAHLHRGDVGYGSDASRRQLDELAALGVNWVALTDFAYMPDVRQPGLRWGRDRSLSDAGLRRTIADAHERGLKVMLKPHIWSNQFWQGNEWHGTIEMQSDADWQSFFSSYGDFIVEQATLASDTGADALCIGVEMKLVSPRSDDWRKLVARVREVYDGTLTYSANSDEWDSIDWWDAVDCIGITAYFPLADDEHAAPTEAQVREVWTGIFDRMRPFAARFDRPVCFTELGFSASRRAAVAPWEHHEVDPDPALQAMLYRVSVDEISRSNVVSGVFLWKWFTADADVAARMERGDVFGLQNRPLTLDVLRERWSDEPAE